METTKRYPFGRALAGILFLASGINKIIAFGYVAGGAPDVQSVSDPAHTGGGHPSKA